MRIRNNFIKDKKKNKFIRKKRKALNNKILLSTKKLFIIYLLLFIIIIYSLLKRKNQNISQTINLEKNEKIGIFNTNSNISFEQYSLKKISSQEFKIYTEYINNAIKGNLLYPENLKKVKNPKISIIISILNREEFINSTIKSVQNQKMKDIEIIIVDDYSTDNSIKYIKKAQKSDPRIKLYKNKKNMGTLYTKSIGALHAIGEYLILLDSDTMLGKEDYLDTAYNSAKEKNIDILDCNALFIDLVIKKAYVLKPFYVTLWTKLIKTKIFHKVIYGIGKEILKSKIIVHDDDLIALYLFHRVSKKYINIIGVINFIHKGEHVFFNNDKSKQNLEKYCLNLIRTLKGFYDLRENKGKKTAKLIYNGFFKNKRAKCNNYFDKDLMAFYKNL